LGKKKIEVGGRCGTQSEEAGVLKGVKETEMVSRRKKGGKMKKKPGGGFIFIWIQKKCGEGGIPPSDLGSGGQVHQDEWCAKPKKCSERVLLITEVNGSGRATEAEEVKVVGPKKKKGGGNWVGRPSVVRRVRLVPDEGGRGGGV